MLTFRDSGHSPAFGPSLLELRMIPVQGAAMPFIRNGLKEALPGIHTHSHTP